MRPVSYTHLILDEPTAGLDPRERVRFRNLIHALSGERIVILSTHIVSDIETIAGQIVMFKGHRLYCCDSPTHIREQFRGRVFELSLIHIYKSQSRCPR